MGEVFCDPSVLNPTKDLSCQYFRTPVEVSYEITLPTAVVPVAIVCVIVESGENTAILTPIPVNRKA